MYMWVDSTDMMSTQQEKLCFMNNIPTATQQ
jgi:hypothetical protein